MATPASFDDIQRKHLAAIAAACGLPLERFETAQTLCVTEEARTDSGMAVAYHVGRPTIIRVDPALAEQVGALVDPTTSISSSDFASWAERRGWNVIGGGDQHLITSSDLVIKPMPEAAQLIELDRTNDADRTLISTLLDENDPDDVDEAEFDLDDLDPHILGLVDGDGRLNSMVSGRFWEEDEDFDDIGILTHERVRGQGWGAAAVSAFCVASFDRGRVPLYRCDWSRTASKALAMSLGFQLVGQVSAVGPREA